MMIAIAEPENRKVKEAINNVIGTPYLDSLINNLILIKKNIQMNLIINYNSIQKTKKES